MMEFVTYDGEHGHISNAELLLDMPVDPDFGCYLLPAYTLYRVWVSKSSYDQVIFMTDSDWGKKDIAAAKEQLTKWIPEVKVERFDICGNSIVMHSDRSGGYDT